MATPLDWHQGKNSKWKKIEEKRWKSSTNSQKSERAKGYESMKILRTKSPF